MIKKVYLMIIICMILAAIRNMPYLAEGIGARGLGGVNYGSVFIPFLIGIWAFYKYRKWNKNF